MLPSEMLKIVNNHGETYLLHPNYDELGVLAVEGLERPETPVSISDSGTTDGGRYNSSRIEKRTIVIHMVLFGWTETERKKLYRMFPAKSPVDLYYRNSEYNVKTTGYTQHIDIASYGNRTKVRVEMVCPDPYLHGVDEIVAVPSGIPLTCTIENGADGEIGFKAEIKIETSETPSLVQEITQIESPEYLGDHTLNLLPQGYAFDNIDLANETFNVFINGNLQEPSENLHIDLMTMPSGHKILWMDSDTGGFANSKLTYEHIVVSGKSIADMRYWQSKEFQMYRTESETTGIYTASGIPSWFDADNDCIVLAYTRGAVGRANVTNVQIKSQEPDGTYTVSFTYQETTSDHYGELRIFGSMSHVDVSQDTITRDSLDGAWYDIGTYTNRILDPAMPNFDPDKDIRRIYKGYKLLEESDYRFDTLTKSDGTTTQQMYISSSVDQMITFETISSNVGDDIRDYTQQEIDDLLCLVDNLKISNSTTGESMTFPSVQLQNGDKIEISTVPGNMYAIITESDWIEPGTSLLSDVIMTGSFFKLASGENIIRITSDTNFSYIGAEFSAEKLYGGV